MHAVVFYCFVVLVWAAATFPAVAVTAGADSANGLLAAVDDMLVAAATDRALSLPPLRSFPGDHLPFTNISYNRADGLFLGIGGDKRQALRLFDSSVLAHVGLGYSFASHYWQVVAGLARRTGERNTATVIGAECYHRTDSRDSWKIPSWENSLHALAAREDYLTWFRHTGFSVYAEQFLTRDFSVVAELAADRYSPLERAVSWSLFGGDKVFPDNPVFSRTDLRTLSLSVRYNGLPALPRTGVGVRVSAQVETSWLDLSYERWLADVVVHTAVPAATLNSRLRIGSVTGDAFVPVLFAIGGAGTLPGHALNEYGGNRMVVWNTELLVHGAAFTRSRLGTSMSLVLFCDIGYAARVAAEDVLWKGLLPEEMGAWKSDIGIALGSANGRLRIGAAWRTDRREAPSLVVRFSPVIETARQ